MLAGGRSGSSPFTRTELFTYGAGNSRISPREQFRGATKATYSVTPRQAMVEFGPTDWGDRVHLVVVALIITIICFHLHSLDSPA